MLASVCCGSLSVSFFWFCLVLLVLPSAPVSHLCLITLLPLYLKPSCVFFGLECYCLYSWPAPMSLPPVWVCLPVFDCLPVHWSLPSLQSVKLLLTHHFSLCNIWIIVYMLYKTWLTAGHFRILISFRPLSYVFSILCPLLIHLCNWF